MPYANNKGANQPAHPRSLKENDQKQLNRDEMKVFLRPNCLVQISCKSDFKQESY